MNNLKLLLTLLLGIFLNASLLQAQGWKRLYGEGGNDQGRGICQTFDGGLMTCGDFGFYNPDGVPQGHLLRTDQNGYLIWEQAYDSTGSLYEVMQLNDSSFISVGKRDDLAWALRVDTWGNEIWNVTLNNTSTNSRYTDLRPISDSTFIAAGNQVDPNCNCDRVILTKYGINGTTLWTNQYGASGIYYTEGVEKTHDGHFLVTGYHSSINTNGGEAFLMKIDANGTLVWEKDVVTESPIDYGFDVIQTSDSNYVITGQIDTSQGFEGPTMFVLKTDQNGDDIWEYIFPDHTIKSIGYSLVETPQNDIVIAGTVTENTGGNGAYMMKISSDGVVQWKQRYDWIGPNLSWAADVEIVADGKMVFVGAAAPFGQYDLVLVKTDSLGVLYSNEINGTVFFDQNEDCFDNSEPPMEGWIVTLTGNDLQFGVTDSNGYYSFQVDTGNYVVSITYPNPYWQACANSIPVSFTSFYNTMQEDFAVQAIVDCPYLWVDISTPFLRRCFPNTYYLSYCNLGPVSQDSAFIEVTFDQWLSVDSSSIPWTSVNGNTYTFDVGTLEFGDCGIIEIYTYLDCDSTVLGQTHCVEAYMFPDSLCLPPDSLWSGASLEVSAECQGDSILFIIHNVGQNGMDELSSYIIIEDHVMLQIDNPDFQLGSGETFEFSVPANGATYRMEVPQVTGHPGFSMPSVTVEGCTNSGGGTISLGFVTQYTEDDADPFVSIDCQENIGAYDPNDKMGYPKGYMEEHLIEANTDLEYKIRFQNTGTDTAFRVVILDTLSSFLNPASMVPGASSHDYEFDLLGNGVARFTFNNIMLPDSNVNEAASHGFVKFRISQKPNNPDGTIIYNDAAIYFDFNAPIITNTSVHRIGEGFIMVSVDPQPERTVTELTVSPNPFQERTIFKLENQNFQSFTFELYDQSGRRILTEQVGGNLFEFDRNGLPAGLYFFRVSSEGKLLGSGKMVMQ